MLRRSAAAGVPNFNFGSMQNHDLLNSPMCSRRSDRPERSPEMKLEFLAQVF